MLAGFFCVASMFTLGVLVLMMVMLKWRLRHKWNKIIICNQTKFIMKVNNQQKIKMKSKPFCSAHHNIMGWTAILSNSINGLFAPELLHFTQSSLSATYSFSIYTIISYEYFICLNHFHIYCWDNVAILFLEWNWLVCDNVKNIELYVIGRD